MSHRWEDLRPEQFYAEFERAPLAYLAAAAPEEHGLHNPLGTDLWPPYEVCLRAAEITGGIIFPLIPFAPAYFPGLSRAELRARDKELFPPSLFVSRELCELAYLEVLEGMADMGFKACIALAGHAPADKLMRDLTEEHGGRIGNMRFFGAGTYSLLSDFLAELNRDGISGGHGCMWETSLMMALAPDKVHLPRAQEILQNPLKSQLQANSPEVIAQIAHANAELGEESLRRLVDTVAQKASELLS
jgi:creatinine amidohydrolase/Fe(II)-dependent formamide hydrolase-like protein